MIFTLSWNIEEKVYSVAGEYESLFRIYWSLKETLKNMETQRDIYIQCNNAQGQPIDLLRGMFAHLAPKGEEKVLISKGIQNYRKNPL